MCDKQTDSMAGITAEVRRVIEGYLAKAKGGTLVQSVNGLHDFLLKQKLAWRLKLSCEFVGVHPENRDGLGISASHVADLISNISSIGFSTAETRAICVEIPEDSRGNACRDFNRRLAEEAKGKLAPVEAYLVKYASIVGSHSNQASRAFVYGIPHDDEKVCIEGRLSLEKLALLDPAWCSSIREGLEWMVVSYQVCEAFPEYVGLAQSAGNAAGQIASGEGELQLARKVNQAIQEFMNRTGKDTVAYSDVAPGILRSKPRQAVRCRESLPLFSAMAAGRLLTVSCPGVRSTSELTVMPPVLWGRISGQPSAVSAKDRRTSGSSGDTCS